MTSIKWENNENDAEQQFTSTRYSCTHPRSQVFMSVQTSNSKCGGGSKPCTRSEHPLKTNKSMYLVRSVQKLPVLGLSLAHTRMISSLLIAVMGWLILQLYEVIYSCLQLYGWYYPLWQLLQLLALFCCPYPEHGGLQNSSLFDALGISPFIMDIPMYF